jgi:hypothetical protein
MKKGTRRSHAVRRSRRPGTSRATRTSQMASASCSGTDLARRTLPAFSSRAYALPLRKVRPNLGVPYRRTAYSRHTAPVTGYMFGKGVYFADMMSKVGKWPRVRYPACLTLPLCAHSQRTTAMLSGCRQHCRDGFFLLSFLHLCSLSDNTGVLLLCEVAAKPFYEQLDANYNADQ